MFKHMIYIETPAEILQNLFTAFLVKVITPDTRDLFIGVKKVYFYKKNTKDTN